VELLVCTFAVPAFVQPCTNLDLSCLWLHSALLPRSTNLGKPKAIKHGAGALILSQKKSNALHSNCKPTTVYLQFSTLGWMMWNLSISCLASGAAIVLYDGSPLSPMSILWDLVDLHKVTTLGISPRYLQALLTSKYYPNQKHDLKSLVRLPLHLFCSVHVR
jgi:acetoacetyl-CoA synthetase